MYGEALKGRIAVVTGGARGIGFACAQALQAAGARIAIWDRDEAVAQEAAKALAGAVAVAVDVADDRSVAGALSDTETRLGGVDILVASAGITGPNASVADYDVQAWRQVIDINLTGVFLTNRAVVPGMVARNWGRIVNIASIAGKEGNPNASAYSASKAGVIGLTKSLGKELANSGVLANCICPAAIKTDLFKQMTQQHIDFMLSKIPMGRFATVEEAAALVTWLASPLCSFNTGAVFDLSGGRATY
ncbi:MAG: SDR family oxidoreductase [Alphaproteobacteria bacterium]|nr:SDR family oxidoreductase [Alphaproteobacteria bacterium]MCW5740172.1 SDR family oxidoreductase [Alphaproteobacteria bacterium]